MLFSRQKLVDSQVFSLAPRYYLHIYMYIPVACFFLSFSFFLPYTVEHFILMITGKKLLLFWVKNVSNNSLTRLREETITRQPGN